MQAVSGCAFITGPSPAVIAPPPSTLAAENVRFQSESGSRIHAWYVRGRPGAGAVLLLHGVGSNRTSMESRAAFLHDEGFTVLAPDFQAHGESPGEHTTFGALESLDAEAAMNFLRTVAPGERIGVIGVSMGGAATLLGRGPISADAFVLESVYPTIRNAVSDRLATWLGPLGGVGRHFTSTALRIIHSQTGVTEADLQPIRRIGSVRAPILLISGTADRYTPIAEAESLFVQVRSPKMFWPVSGAAHEDLYAYAKAEYSKRVGGFLEQNLRSYRGSSALTAARQ